MTVMQYTNRPAPAALPAGWALLGNKPEGIAVDFCAMNMAVRDRTTPANNFSGDPGERFSYTSPSTKWICDGLGQMVSGTTLRCDHDRGTLDSSNTPLTSFHANKTLTIVGATDYRRGVQWLTATSFVPGTVVKNGTGSYICLASHTSAATSEPGVGATWQTYWAAATGHTVRVTASADATRWMLGKVVSFNTATKALTLAVYASSGPISGSSWKVIVALGIVSERQSTNAIIQSADLSNNTAWTNWLGGAVTPVASIFSGGTSYKFAGNGTGSTSRTQTTATLPDSSPVCHWAIIEQDTGTFYEWGVYDLSAGAFIGGARFNWATETVSVLFGSLVRSGVVNLGIGPNGGKLRLVWLVVNTGASGQVRRIYNYPNGTGGNTLATIIHHVQIEPMPYPTTPIVTGASAVTRAADNIRLLTSLFPYTAAAQTVMVECDFPYGSDLNNGARWAFTLGHTSNDRYQSYNAGSGRNYISLVSGGTTSVIGNAAPTSDAMIKTAWRIQSADSAVSQAGSPAVGVAVPASMPAATTTLYLAQSFSGISHIDGHIKSFVFRPDAASNAELQAMAA
ncbi:hypothetical protein [Mesorhizobium sp. BE184]|uniref:phage head spike fiber domain-containing protein n=1 Tax=Mesorhizobium sp. BE184 TaxID=2817714 RepID=UPI00285D6B8E|nr:hypothetical protein [Mesorhizobium sp. BE184]MDR7034483.1 hypothetical protein [Mesorhizobium sp. BE184]